MRVTSYEIKFPLEVHHSGRPTNQRVHDTARAFLSALSAVPFPALEHPLAMITEWRVDYSQGQIVVSACVPEDKGPEVLRREICEAVQTVLTAA